MSKDLALHAGRHRVRENVARAVDPSLLPPFYEFMGRWMPTGAAVNAIRDPAYFPGHVHAEPYIVFGAWFVVTTALFVTLRLYRYGPGTPGDTVNGFVHRLAVPLFP